MAGDDTLFDPARYAGVRRPLLAAATLPPHCYTAPAFYAREIERIFRRHWNLIGRAEQVPRPGDFLSVDLAGAPLVVLRGDDGIVRAFANSCRHRGARLVSGTGACRALSCPYHGWSYARDGSLIAAAGMDQTEGFNHADYGLIPVQLAEWAGFMFVNLAGVGPDLAAHLGNLAGLLGSHRAETMVCTRLREYDLACNWKLCLENQRESYHVATVHRATLKDQFPDQLAAKGHWSGSFLRHDGSIAARLGADAAFSPMASLADRATGGTFFIGLYPGTFLVFSIDCMWWMSFRPVAPDKTKLVVGVCFEAAAARKPGFDAIAGAYYDRLDASHPEDNAATENQQRGLASPYARPGRFSHREAGVHAFDNWILDQVLDPA